MEPLAPTRRRVSAASFKTDCLRLMDEVAERRASIIITKRGKPVAKLVPPPRSAIGGSAAITAWETALLASRGRLVLGKRSILWVEEAVAASTVSILPPSPSVAVESWELPGTFHADPGDRIIVATARMAGATVLTRDRLILDYAARGHLMAIAA
jgi:prevent-host-death family protein